MRSARLPLLLWLVVATFTGCATPPPVELQPELVVFLVRHAEKAGRGRDPELSAAGKARAEALATILRSAGIEQIHSSNYRRTRATAAPFAKAADLEVQLYDPRNLPALVDGLRSTGGRHLVVGHSNTTPTAVELLGADPGSPITEQEYDRLYAVVIGPDGTVTSTLLHFGAASGG
ncbi:MAG: histidine phosphatase family protein [bacterium]|nr:histidine phosphatase family protein [bacterium]